METIIVVNFQMVTFRIIIRKRNKYILETLIGEFHGKGTYYFLSKNQYEGDKYVGEYLNGKRTGKGVYHYNNEDVYIGEFVNGSI